MFRFDYSVEFLRWALSPPGYLSQWHVGVRNIKTKALMGCITAIPVDVRVYDKVRMEILSFCVAAVCPHFWYLYVPMADHPYGGD